MRAGQPVQRRDGDLADDAVPPHYNGGRVAITVQGQLPHDGARHAWRV